MSVRTNSNKSVPDTASLTAFGELSVAEPTVEAQMQFPYNINAEITESRANQSGVIDQNNSMLRLQSGAATNSSGTALSVRSVAYKPGQGVDIRGTAVFGTGVANSTQWLGVGDQGDGFFFGYNGATFGIMTRKGGVPEIRTITITAKSTTAEDITVTLDGDDTTDVSVTDATGGDVTTTAGEIAAHDYSDVGRGWTAHSMGPIVVFVSWGDGAKTGTYELSQNTTATFSTAQLVAGVAAVETVVAQTAWNEDKANGSDELPVLIPTNGNVYQIRYQWLGFGTIDFYVESPTTGHFVLVHRIPYANAFTTPSINNPSLPLCAAASNTTNSTNVIMHVGSMAGFVEGKDDHVGVAHSTSGTNAAVSNTEIPILTLHNKAVYQSKQNRTRVHVKRITASTEGTKIQIIRARIGATLTGAVFADVSANTSVMSADVTATAVSGGTIVESVTLGKIDSDDIGEDFILLPGQFITFSAEASASSSNQGTITVTWDDEF